MIYEKKEEILHAQDSPLMGLLINEFSFLMDVPLSSFLLFSFPQKKREHVKEARGRSLS